MHARSDSLTKAIEAAIAEAHCKRKNIVVYFLELALIGAMEEQNNQASTQNLKVYSLLWDKGRRP